VLGVSWCDARQLAARHCRPTGEERLENTTATVLAGKQVVVVPTVRVSYRYRCDDGEVWR
jgi:hypothetical protein